VKKFKKTVVTLLAAMMLSVGLAPAAFAGSDNAGAGGAGVGGPVSCLVSIGSIAAGVGAILGTGSAQSTGTSCSSFGTGGGGGNA
jgi:hypothetical protein